MRWPKGDYYGSIGMEGLRTQRDSSWGFKQRRGFDFRLSEFVETYIKNLNLF